MRKEGRIVGVTGLETAGSSMDGVTDLDGTSLSTFDDFLDMLRGGTDCSVSELNHSGVEIEDTLEDNLAVEGEP